MEFTYCICGNIRDHFTADNFRFFIFPVLEEIYE